MADQVRAAEVLEVVAGSHFSRCADILVDVHQLADGEQMQLRIVFQQPYLDRRRFQGGGQHGMVGLGLDVGLGAEMFLELVAELDPVEVLFTGVEAEFSCIVRNRGGKHRQAGGIRAAFRHAYQHRQHEFADIGAHFLVLHQ